MTINGFDIEALPASPTRPLLTREGKSSKSRSSKDLLKQSSNLLKILRDAVGKDLTRMTVPVYFNEPLSFLQRATEDIEHSTILDLASDPSLAGTSKRASLIAAFVVSHYCATLGRTGKPFNPLLNETFDLINHSTGIAVISEQVSHHPPVTALHAFSNKYGWTYRTGYHLRSKFHGNSFEAWPEGTVHIEFKNGDHYAYEQAHTLVNNIVVGSLWIDNVGVVNIHDIANQKFDTFVKLKRCSGSVFADSKSFGAVTGEVKLKDGNELCHKIVGNWRKEVRVDGETIWTASERISKHKTAGHTMTEFAWNLNSPLNENDRRFFPKTDSRLRPDERALENGDYSLASSEKDRIEKSQRQRRKENEGNCSGDLIDGVATNGNDVSSSSTSTSTITRDESEGRASWFEMKEDQFSGKREWRYRGGYFEAKLAAANGSEWPDHDIPDIF